jgi:hypothetical protein
MLGIVAFILGISLLTALVALGWVPNTTQPVKHWYPAGPDPEPWRTD